MTQKVMELLRPTGFEYRREMGSLQSPILVPKLASLQWSNGEIYI